MNKTHRVAIVGCVVCGAIVDRHASREGETSLQTVSREKGLDAIINTPVNREQMDLRCEWSDSMLLLSNTAASCQWGIAVKQERARVDCVPFVT